MKKINFKWILGLIYAGMLLTFYLYQGKENLVLNLTVYLIAPLTSIIAGIITLNCLGWQGKRANVLKYVLAALVSWFLAECALLYFAWKGIDSYPSIADALFLAGYALFGKAVISESKLFNLQWKKLNPRLLFALGTAFALIAGIVTYMAIIGYDPEASLLASLVTVSWSMGDLIIGGMSIILLAMAWEYREGTVKRAWLWFIGATTINLIADTIYNLNPQAIMDGSSLDMFLNSMWIGGYFLFAGYFLEMRNEVERLQEKITGQK